MVVASIDLHERKVVGGPEILTKGWAGPVNDDVLSVDAVNAVSAALKKALAEGTHDIEGLNKVARRALGRFVGTKMRQKPMIVPVIVAT